MATAQPRPAGVRTNAFDLADKYLKALGWPSTPTSRRALAAWMMRESPRVPGSKTDIYVVGNNPFNISCFSCGSYWLAGGGTHAIAIFPSHDAGIAAFKSLIHSPNHNYPLVVKAFTTQSNSGAALVYAITHTGWVTGGIGPSYINSSGNQLQATYNDIGGNDLSGKEIDDTSTSHQVGAFGDLIKFTEGHIITEDDIKNMSKILSDHGFFANPVQQIAFEEFMKQNALGKPWNKDLEDKLAKQANVDAGNVNVVPNVLGMIAGKATAFAAIAVGGLLIGFGAWLVVKDTYSEGNGGGMLDITPIIVRE